MAVAGIDRRAAAYRCNRAASIDLERAFVSGSNGVRIGLDFRSGRH